jgi:hypothetical protein
MLSRGSCGVGDPEDALDIIECCTVARMRI